MQLLCVALALTAVAATFGAAAATLEPCQLQRAAVTASAVLQGHKLVHQSGIQPGRQGFLQHNVCVLLDLRSTHHAFALTPRRCCGAWRVC